MKKLLFGIVAVAVAGIMSVGFTACDMGVNAKRITGDEITESQWNDAFKALTDDSADFTVAYYAKGTADYSHTTMVHETEWSAKTVSKMTITRKGNVASSIGYQKISLSGDKSAAELELGKAGKKEVEVYSEIVNKKIYTYEKGRDDRWKKEEVSDFNIDSEFSNLLPELNDSFDQFEYSKKHKGFVSKNYDDDDEMVIVYKFKADRLVAIYMYMENTEIKDNSEEYKKTVYKAEINIAISYSANDITLPTVF